VRRSYPRPGGPGLAGWVCPVCGAAGAPVLADWCSGAGGAGWGYALAGFHIVGFDLKPQPRYPGCFIRADVMTAPLDGYAAFHASPPCLDHRRNAPRVEGSGWLLGAIRDRFTSTARPWVIECVPGAPMRPDYRLCGCMYGLSEGPYMITRERWFETSWGGFTLRPPCVHDRQAVTVIRSGAKRETPRPRSSGHQKHVPQAVAERLMGIGWMTRRELGNAIPPPYTTDLGHDLMTTLVLAS